MTNKIINKECNYFFFQFQVQIIDDCFLFNNWKIPNIIVIGIIFGNKNRFKSMSLSFQFYSFAKENTFK